MNPTLFPEYAERFMPSIQKLTEKINGGRKQLTYLSKGENSILRTEFSPDNKYEISTVSTKYIAADFVAADSPLPLKSRGTLSTASGRLPKLGMKRMLRESDLTTVLEIQSKGTKQQEVMKRLTADPVACSTGIDEKIEYALLFGLSNGYVALADDSKPGELLRINYGYLPENTFSAEEKGQISLEDIRRMIEKAISDGNSITRIYIARKAYNALRATRAARELVAIGSGQVVMEDAVLPVPRVSAFNEAFRDEFGAEIVVVDRSVVVEKNGQPVKVIPWNPSRVIGTCTDQVGALVYGQLAEEKFPVEGVTYQLVDKYKLIAKYSSTDPLTEMTTGQALAAPIIENADQIYIYDFSAGEEVDETKEAADTLDKTVTVWGETYNKTQFIALLKDYVSIKANASDAAVIKAVNSLTEGDVTALKAQAESCKAEEVVNPG